MSPEPGSRTAGSWRDNSGQMAAAGLMRILGLGKRRPGGPPKPRVRCVPVMLPCSQSELSNSSR